jgi:glycine/D-amino acid oxidase-like deaminating enzyme
MRSRARFRPPAAVAPEEQALWLDQALSLEGPVAEDRLPAATDVCVVGGGFTGLWTAIQLKQRAPATHVVVVEAGICGQGASGRNGGFVMTSWSKFASLKKLCGVDDALRYARAVERAVGEIGAFCAAEGIDAHFRQGGWLWTATNPSQIDAWKHTLDELAAAGEHPYRLLDRDEVAQRSGSPVHVAGVFERAPATVHPGRLVRGLARVARRLGVTVVEQVPMTELLMSSAPEVVTTRGTIRAGRVVVAAGAWAAALPDVRRSVLVVASDVIATPPIAERIAQLGWEPGLSISDSRRLVNYYRTTDDGRIVFGKGGGDLALGARVTASFDRSDQRAGATRQQFYRIYPMLSDVPVQRHWRGPVDYSTSGLPFVGPLPGCPQVLAAIGFSGNGVGPSYVAGVALAQMALGDAPEEIPEGLQRPQDGGMPPEPIRYLGGRMVREAVRRKEQAEDGGGAPGRLLSLVAGLDPTSFTDRGPADGA